MKRYTIHFLGRPVGAIGITWDHTLVIEAENEDAAILKLWDTHEHISCIRITRD